MRPSRWLRRLLPGERRKDQGLLKLAGGGNAESLVKRSSHEGFRSNEPRCIEVHEFRVTSLAFLSDGKYIIAGCTDGSIRQWSTSAGDRREIGRARKSDSAVSSIAASSDGKWVAVGEANGKVTIWRATARNGEIDGPVKHFEMEAGVAALDISRDSSGIAAGLEDGSVFFWRPGSGERIAGPFRHWESRVSSVKFSPAGDRLASAYADWDCDSICIWDVCSGDRIACLSADTKPTYSLAWSHDGQQLFAGGPYGFMRCFNMTDQSIISRFGGHFSDFVTSLCISHSGRFLVAASASCHSLSFWDVNRFQKIQPTPLQPTEALTIAISSDDQHMVAATDNKILIWNIFSVVPRSYSYRRLAPYLRDSKPLTYLSQAVLNAWQHGKLEEAEEYLSNEIIDQDLSEFREYSRANRALVRVRLGKWDEALEDAQLSNSAPLLIAYIAQSFALFRKENYEEATKVFESASAICDDESRPIVELIKLIILFECGDYDVVESIRHGNNSTTNVELLRSAVEARMLVLIAERFMKEQRYAQANQVLEEANAIYSPVQIPELTMFRLISGWNFDGDLKSIIQQQKCKALFACGSVREAIRILLTIRDDLRRDGRGLPEWFGEFNDQCLTESERLGDEAMANKGYADGISWYSTMLDLNPTSPEQIYMKRSEAYAAIHSWENALINADEVIARSPSLPQAYATKISALHNLGRHTEVAATCDGLPDQLRHRHMLVTGTVERVVSKMLQDLPVRMIDTKTGLLCNEEKLGSVFKDSPLFWDLVLSITEVDDLASAHIQRVVGEFFQYAMFSHRWQTGEPLHSDVGDQSVYSLPTRDKPAVVKLQTFCKIAGKAGYRWAWSDTCCIKKTEPRETEKSINSMFKWYHRSALTLVYLADVPSLSQRGGLSRCAWITRGWTLQEFLASSVIRFYDADWNLYLLDPCANHKESDAIMAEIASAVSVSAKELLSFRPSSENVRWKLHLASRRTTTVPEDSAYCLCGIFNVFMSVTPAEPEHHAVGRLLREVISRSKSRDVGCLAWVGEPSELNSCLPAQIRAYQKPCHTPVSFVEEETMRSVSELESSFTREEQAHAVRLLSKLQHLSRAEFSTGWCLRLPCISFRINAFDEEVISEPDTKIYIAKADGLEVTRICTKDDFPKEDLLLVWPWIQELLNLVPPRSCRKAGSSSNERARVLRFLAKLRHPTTALLLSAQGHFRGDYKRVAADNEIVVQLDKEASLDTIDVKVVEII